jgi:hypothetical protein
LSPLENFDEGDYYYVVLDLVVGGEMFDALCADGAYSEADVSALDSISSHGMIQGSILFFKPIFVFYRQHG